MKDISLQIEVRRYDPTSKTYKGADWQYADLSDADLTLELVGVIMNEDKGGTYSYPFTLDVEENAHIFGSSAELRGDSVYNTLHGARCRLMAGGLPIIQGKIDLDTSVDIKVKSNGHHEVEVKVVSRNKSYEEKIEGAKLRDLNLKKYNIQIGYCLPQEMWFVAHFKRNKYKLINGITSAEKEELEQSHFENPSYECPNAYWADGLWYELGEKTVEYKHVPRYISLPKFMLPKYYDPRYGGQYQGDFSNASEPYNPDSPLTHPFCNTRVCYQKYVYDSDAEKWEKERGYSVGEYDRLNSAPCFYLGFVFDVAMSQLGIAVRSNSLNDIMDYKRMAFWHADPQYEVADLDDSESIMYYNDEDNNHFVIDADYRSGKQYDAHNEYVAKDGGLYVMYQYEWEDEQGNDTRSIVPGLNLKKAMATADNLPDLDVKELVEDVIKPFGGVVVYDSFMESMDIVLLRDVMRDSEHSVTIPCDITSEYKTENDNRGFRLKYSGANTISRNTITKAKNESEGSDETAYNYEGYDNVSMLEEGKPYSSYKDLVLGVGPYDMNLYVDTITGNMFRIKVDKDAKNQGEWFASTFEVAGYRDVELGDCSEDEYVKTVSIPFSPVISSMVNQEQIRIAQQNGEKTPILIYAQYIDGEIHNNDDGTLIDSKYVYDDVPLDIIVGEDGKSVHGCHIDIEVNIKSLEGWGDNATDAPYFDNECENVIGIMRGSGSDAGIVYYDQNCDGFGTEKYMLTAGSDAEFFSDSVNHFGQMFDYDGDAGTTVNITPSEVPAKLRLYFGESNANLISPSRKVSGDAVRAKGWDVEGDYCTVLSRTYTYLGMDYLFTPIMDDGTILTMAELDAYFDKVKMAAAVTTNDIVVTADKNNKKLFIGRYATSNNDHTESDTFAILLHELHEVYYGNQAGTVTFPENGLGYLPSDAISLKLKAEKPKDGDESKGEYYDINPTFAKRGLWDKFYVDWAHFWLNHHIANLTMRLELAAFSQIALDTTKWYTFGEYTGLIKNGTAKLLDDGMVQLDLKLAYI